MSDHDPYAVLRYRSFRLFITGTLLANLGSQMLTVAVGWELYERTHSAMALGWVGFIQFLPIILLALPAGHLADRLERRRIVMIAQSFTASAALGLAIFSYLGSDVRWMYLCLFLTGTARAVAMPSAQSMMPLLVPRNLFSNAVTWRTSAFHLASTMGPALGGLLIAQCRLPAVVYGTNAVLTLAGVACLAGVQTRATEPTTATLSIRTLLAGARFVWQTKLILATMTLDLFAVLLGGATALLPVYAKDILHVGPTGLGWLRAAPAIGALGMGLCLAHRPPLKRAGPAMLAAVLGFGLATIVFGISRNYVLSLAMLFLTGVLDNISVVIRHTLIQTATPDALRGRVSAVNGLFISCSNELGGFESGLVAACFTTVVSVVSGGVGTILVVLGVAGLWPQLRKLKKLQPAATPVSEEEDAERPSA